MFPLLPQRFWESELSPNISLVPKCSLMYSEKVLKELYSLAGLRSFYKKRAEQIFVEQFLRKLSATVLKSISHKWSISTQNDSYVRMVLTEICYARVMNEALILCILPLSSCVQLFNWYLRNDKILFIWLFYTVFVMFRAVS